LTNAEIWVKVGSGWYSEECLNEGREYSLEAYREINGIMVPVKGEAVWRLSSGDFS